MKIRNTIIAGLTSIALAISGADTANAAEDNGFHAESLAVEQGYLAGVNDLGQQVILEQESQDAKTLEEGFETFFLAQGNNGRLSYKFQENGMILFSTVIEMGDSDPAIFTTSFLLFHRRLQS